MRELTLSDLKELFGQDQGKRPVLLLGAGASMPGLPTAGALKKEIVCYLWNRAKAGREGMDLPRGLQDRLYAPHLTLEVLCSMIRYRCGRDGDQHLRFDPFRLWNSVVRAEQVNLTTRYVAELAKRDLLGGIITSNFDDFVPRALNDLDIDYSFLTQNDAKIGATAIEKDTAAYADQLSLPVIAFHGTVHEMEEDASPEDQPHTPPSSALARGLATPLITPLRELVEELLRPRRPVIAIGYSGNDHYDLNPLIRQWSGPEDTNRWWWLSYDERIQTNFSSFVRGSYSDRVVKANAEELLRRYVNEVLKTDVAAPLRPDKDQGKRWGSKLRATLDEMKLDSDSCAELIEDIERNLPGAWVVLEHYYLYSSVYDETVTLTFGGIDADKEEGATESTFEEKDTSSGVSHLQVLDTNWESLLRSQYVYRCEDHERTSLPDEERAAFAYQNTSKILNSILEEFSARLQKGNLRTVDLAVLRVGQAYAEDYLGLIENKRRVAIDSLLSEAGESNSPRRAEWRRQRDCAREEALKRFKACQDRAQEAGRELTSDGIEPTKELMELVQHHIWEMIGRENYARAMEPSESISEFRSCIQYRLKVIEQSRKQGDDDYHRAHYSQLGLRASEMMKNLLGISGRWDPPRLWGDLSDKERDEFEFALHNAREAHREFGPRLINRNFPGYYEVELLAAVSQGDKDKAHCAISECRAIYDRAPARMQTRVKPWVSDVCQRFENSLKQME